MPHAIETVGLRKQYPVPKRYRDLLLHPFRNERRTALEDVSLRIPKGQLAGLLGRNGAGKTTLIKILCTLVLPSEGRALVNGFDVAREDRAVRRSIGFVVSEERSFYWRLTGRQNLAFFATLNDLAGVRRERRVEEVLRLVGLAEQADRMFKDYSSGMKQRLAIARGLLTDPEILFLDEPTKTLDPLIARELRHLVKEVLVGQYERSVVFATNNLKEAEDLFDSVAILERGRLVASGTRHELGRLFASEERHALRVRDPRGALEPLLPSLEREGFAISLEPRDADSRSYELAVVTRQAQAAVARLIARLVQSGIEVESCTPVEPSLEDLFSRIVEPVEPVEVPGHAVA